MGEFDLGKYFKSRIQNHSEEIDTDAIWNSLDLDNEKKRKLKIFWIFGLSLFMLLGIGLVSMYVQASKIQKLEKEISEIALIANQGSNVKTSPVDDWVKPNENVNSNKSSGDAESVMDVNMVSNVDQETNTNVLTNNSRIKNPIHNTAIPNTAIPNIAIPNTAIPNTQILNTAIPNTAIPNTAILKTQILNTPISVPNPTDGHLSFSQLKLLPIGLLDHSERFVTLPLHRIKVMHPEVKRDHRFYLGLYSGYNFIYRTLSSTQAQENDALLVARNTTESALEMITVGLDLKCKLNSNWYIKSGLEYQSINEKFAFELNSNDTILENNLVVEQFVSAQSDTTNITGSGLVQQAITEKWVNYNSHKIFNLPISVGYQLSNNRRWNFYVEGSFIINVSRRFEGLQLNRDLIAVEQPSYFTKALNIGYALSAGITYNPVPRINVYLQPRYQKMLQSFTNRADGINQHYQMYGVRLGISYLMK